MRDNLTERIVSLLTELEEQREMISEAAASLREARRTEKHSDSYTQRHIF